MIIYSTPVLGAPVISLPEKQISKLGLMKMVSKVKSKSTLWVYFSHIYTYIFIVIVVFYESNWVAFQVDSIWNYSPVQCGWVHPVKKHSQQLLVGHLKEKT